MLTTEHENEADKSWTLTRGCSLLMRSRKSREPDVHTLILFNLGQREHKKKMKGKSCVPDKCFVCATLNI